jgi:hypothetical protein
MNIKATERNVIVKIELDNKEKYRFSNGTEIIIQKGFDYNLRQDAPSLAEIVDGDDLPSGSLCLVHHNASHPTFNIPNIFDEEGNEIKNLYSISTDMVFCYKEENKNWHPTKEFLITLRLYKEYKGFLVGIEPEQIPQMLYVVSGKVNGIDLSGKVVITSKFSDYEIIFHEDGRETSLVRTRVREIFGINNELTEQVMNGEILIGSNLKKAKKINKCQTNQ